ncbi:MAG: toll/interleukin-1 receptor domain-containing protein [Clostridia bacterium]|nr:toll/interleukin-1 receptor domain-containing protein [Clostridia bacterium]
MYTAFNLKIKLSDLPNIETYIGIGKQQKRKLSDVVKKDLDNFILSDETIDGNKLSQFWFKTIDSDIFISHSHNDEDLAYALAGWLKKEFDLEVFLDEVVWGSADALIKKLDKRYSYQEETKTYNYDMRNLTTSHVHAMLSTAIQSVMNNSETIFFLNTDESFPAISDVLKENNNFTLSPWIYQEVQNAKLLRPINWSIYRKNKSLSHSIFESSSNYLKIAYKTPISDFTVIDSSTLSEWQEKKEKLTSSPYKSLFYTHPLDLLYDIVFERKM